MKYVLLAGAAALALSAQAQAAGGIKFQGIEGSSAAQGREGWSDIETVWANVGQVIPESGIPAADAKVVFYDFSVRKALDASSAAILQGALDGTVFSAVTIKSDLPQGALTYELRNVRVTSFSFDDLGFVNLSVNAEKVKVVVERVDAAGVALEKTEANWSRN